jgi:hypothetical protein
MNDLPLRPAADIVRCRKRRSTERDRAMPAWQSGRLHLSNLMRATTLFNRVARDQSRGRAPPVITTPEFA